MLSENILPFKTEKGLFFLNVNDIVQITEPERDKTTSKGNVFFNIELKTVSTQGVISTNTKKISYSTASYGNCPVEDLLAEVKKIYDALVKTILGSTNPIGDIPTVNLKKK